MGVGERRLGSNRTWDRFGRLRLGWSVPESGGLLRGSGVWFVTGPSDRRRPTTLHPTNKTRGETEGIGLETVQEQCSCHCRNSVSPPFPDSSVNLQRQRELVVTNSHHVPGSEPVEDLTPPSTGPPRSYGPVHRVGLLTLFRRGVPTKGNRERGRAPKPVGCRVG